jgi:hypothetical protein
LTCTNLLIPHHFIQDPGRFLAAFPGIAKPPVKSQRQRLVLKSTSQSPQVADFPENGLRSLEIFGAAIHIAPLEKE